MKTVVLQILRNNKEKTVEKQETMWIQKTVKQQPAFKQEIIKKQEKEVLPPLTNKYIKKEEFDAFIKSISKEAPKAPTSVPAKPPKKSKKKECKKIRLGQHWTRIWRISAKNVRNLWFRVSLAIICEFQIVSYAQIVFRRLSIFYEAQSVCH